MKKMENNSYAYFSLYNFGEGTGGNKMMDRLETAFPDFSLLLSSS
jgi:hypothetical protein